MWRQARVWLRNLGLQRRIQLLTLVSLLVIFAFFWWTGQNALEVSTRQNLNHHLTVATLVAAWLDHRLDSALTVLEITAKQPELRSINPGHSVEPLLRDAQLQLSAYGQHLFWLDANGQVLWVEPDDKEPVSAPFPNFASVRLALDQGRRYVSNLCRLQDSSQPYILLAAPVLSPPGPARSLLVEEIEADQLGLAGILEQVAPGGSAYIEVVDHEGNVLASSVPGHCWRKGDHTNQFAGLIDQQKPMVGQCHQCHTGDSAGGASQIDEVLAFAPLEVVPWGVTVRQPASEVLAQVNLLRWQMLLGGAMILAVALLVITWFIRRQVVKPIQNLDGALVQLAAGNLERPISGGGVDEVARLTTNLERMRAKLEATMADQRRWSETLEVMVEERTRELTLLYEQLADKELMRKQLLDKVLTAQEEERTRLARELHDTIGQSLTAIIMTTAAIENNLPPGFPAGKEKLAEVRRIAAQTLRDLRSLIFNLRPEILDDLGLALALRSQTKEYLETAGVKVRLRAAGLKGHLPPEVETVIFRVVQEAITNIARHAHASRADITLTKENGRLVVRVEDDGVGFDPATVMADKQRGWGLRGMQERITLLGGEFYIGPKANRGTLVLAEVPLSEE